jgi:hypothetical protein
MGIAGLVCGIVVFVMAVIAWLPCLGWTNWFLWILPLIAAILSAVGIGVDRKRRVMAIVGLILSLIALCSCVIRGIIAIFFMGA